MSNKITPSKVENDINNLISILNQNSLIIDHNYIYKSKKKNNSRISWKSNITFSGILFASFIEYLTYLENREYTLVLFDGSLIQISYDFNNSDLNGHRLGYYPPPVSITKAELDIYEEVGLGIRDLVLDKLDIRNDLLMRSPLRFDYNPNESVDFPLSHVHLLNENCRVPVFAPINIGYFIRFIFKHFYSDLYNNIKEIKEWPLLKQNICIREIEKSPLFFNC